MRNFECHANFAARLTFLETLNKASGNTGSIRQLLECQRPLLALELNHFTENFEGLNGIRRNNALAHEEILKRKNEDDGN